MKIKAKYMDYFKYFKNMKKKTLRLYCHVFFILKIRKMPMFIKLCFFELIKYQSHT